MSQQIAFNLHFSPGTTQAIGKSPAAGRALVSRLEERLWGTDPGVLRGLFEHSEFKPDIEITDDGPDPRALRTVIAKAVRRYNSFVGEHRQGREKPLRFVEDDDSDPEERGEDDGGSQESPRNCRVEYKETRDGKIVTCVVYSFSLREADKNGKPKNGRDDHELGRLDADTPATGRWQVEFSYEMSEAGSSPAPSSRT